MGGTRELCLLRSVLALAVLTAVFPFSGPFFVGGLRLVGPGKLRCVAPVASPSAISDPVQAAGLCSGAPRSSSWGRSWASASGLHVSQPKKYLWSNFLLGFAPVRGYTRFLAPVPPTFPGHEEEEGGEGPARTSSNQWTNTVGSLGCGACEGILGVCFLGGSWGGHSGPKTLFLGAVHPLGAG